MVASDPLTPTLISEEDILLVKKFVGHDNDGKDLAQVVFLALYLSISRDNRRLPGLTVTVSSELPIGSGLGSSAAYSACLVTGLLLCRGVLPFEKRAGKGDASEWTPIELDLINKWAYLAETIIHGKPSGIDNSVSTFGGILKFKRGKITPFEGNPGLKILLVNTKVSRNTKSLVASVREKLEKYPNVLNPILDAMDSIAEQSCVILSDLASNKAVPEHYGVLEDLVAINQSLLDSLGVGHPKLSDICRLATEHGLHAKLTGAGGGGCAFVLIPPYADASSVTELTRQLETCGFECLETVLGGAGLRLESMTGH